MKGINKILILLIYLYIIIVPFSSDKLKILGASVPGDIILGLIFIIFLVNLVIDRHSINDYKRWIHNFLRDYLNVFMLVLSLIMLISVSYSLNRKLAFTETMRFVSYFVLYIIIRYAIKEKTVYKKMLEAYILISSALSVFGIYQYFTGYGMDKYFISNNNYGARVKIAATLGNPNSYAAYLMLCVFPVILLLIKETRKKYKILYLLSACLIVSNIILTFSRNAIIGLAIGCIILILLYSWKLIYAAGPLGAILLIIPQVRTRIFQIGDKSQNTSRIKLWEAALMMFKEHPVKGVGNGNFITQYYYYINRYTWLKYGGLEYYPCHNSYLKIASELGIIGTIPFLGMIVTMIVKVKRFISDVKDSYFQHFYIGFFASLIAFLFMSISDNLFFVPKTTTYLWLLIAICEGVRKLEQEQKKEQVL